MPARLRGLTRSAAAEVVDAALRGTPRELYGIEHEWPVCPATAPGDRPDPTALRALGHAPLPAGGRVTVEPGGQVELSSAPAETVDAVLDAVHSDTAALHDRLRQAGLVASDLAVDGRRPPSRVLDAPRYAAMEAFFGASGDAGAWMMCNTASLQVNVSHHPLRPDERWELAHRLGPVFVAAFANSPGLDSRGRRWESLRQGIWWSIDPTRTRPPRTRRPMRRSWLDYALAADVMLIGSADGATPLPPGLGFERWMAQGHELGWPTADDLAYHLTTLFPPVRARGWLELRMIDAPRPAHVDVVTLVVATALTVEAAARELRERIPPTDDRWPAAARHGLADPALAAAARTLFAVVGAHLGEVTTRSDRRDAVGDYAERYVARGLAPAREAGDASFACRGPRLGVPEPVFLGLQGQEQLA